MASDSGRIGLNIYTSPSPAGLAIICQLPRHNIGCLCEDHNMLIWAGISLAKVFPNARTIACGLFIAAPHRQNQDYLNRMVVRIQRAQPDVAFVIPAALDMPTRMALLDDRCVFLNIAGIDWQRMGWPTVRSLAIVCGSDQADLGHVLQHEYALRGHEWFACGGNQVNTG